MRRHPGRGGHVGLLAALEPGGDLRELHAGRAPQQLQHAAVGDGGHCVRTLQCLLALLLCTVLKLFVLQKQRLATASAKTMSSHISALRNAAQKSVFARLLGPCKHLLHNLSHISGS